VIFLSPSSIIPSNRPRWPLPKLIYWMFMILFKHCATLCSFCSWTNFIVTQLKKQIRHGRNTQNSIWIRLQNELNSLWWILESRIQKIHSVETHKANVLVVADNTFSRHPSVTFRQRQKLQGVSAMQLVSKLAAMSDTWVCTTKSGGMRGEFWNPKIRLYWIEYYCLMCNTVLYKFYTQN